MQDLNLSLKLNLVLKEEQEKVIEAILRKEDVVAYLPTGYGKSLCYSLPPVLFDKV